MIYILEDSNGGVTLGGTVASAAMIKNGWVEYAGDVPTGTFLKLEAGVLVVDAAKEFAYMSELIGARIESMLNIKAVELGYGSIDTISKYLRPTSPYYNEANSLGVWCDVCYTTATTIGEEIMTGVRPMMTVDEIIAELPAFTLIA